MNELLQRHGCSNVFTIPEGLKELMADISREVLRDQPAKIYDYIANYLSVLLITREHGILSVKILDDLCDCRPSVSEHLMQLGMAQGESEVLAQIIKEEIEGFEPEEGKEKVKEIQILKKILARSTLDETMAAQVCQVVRNAYRDYWYRKKLMEKKLKIGAHETWEIAAERTLVLYKKTKPSFSELTRATQKIQAAYRGYYVRRNLLRHLKPKKAKHPKMDVPGPPIDVAGSREIDLGPVINVRVRHEDTTAEFDKEVGKALNVGYDPMKTITHVEDTEKPIKSQIQLGSRSAAVVKSVTGPAKSEMRKSSFKATEQPDPMEDERYNLPHMDGVSKAEIRKSNIPEPQRKSGVPEPQRKSGVPEPQRKSGVPEPQLSRQIADERSSWTSIQIPPPQMPKISFAEVPVEGIIDDEKALEGTEDGEVPEEILAAGPPQEDAPEVPEDIPDDRTEGDSAPEAYDSAAEADDSAAEADTSAAEADDSAAPYEHSIAAADDSAAEADDSYPIASEPSSAPPTEGDDGGTPTTEDEEE